MRVVRDQGPLGNSSTCQGDVGVSRIEMLAAVGGRRRDLRGARREPITSMKMKKRGGVLGCANLQKDRRTPRRAAEGCDLIR